MTNTPITLEILHAQRKRLEQAFPGSRTFADRRLGVSWQEFSGDPYRGYNGEWFYIDVRLANTPYRQGPQRRYTTVEQINEEVGKLQP